MKNKTPNLLMIGDVWGFKWRGIEAKIFHRKELEPGYKQLGKLNWPGDKGGYGHAYLGYVRRFLFLTVRLECKVAAKIY